MKTFSPNTRWLETTATGPVKKIADHISKAAHEVLLIVENPDISDEDYRANWATGDFPADPAEIQAGLRKLVEAKDCFIRAAVAERDKPVKG
jgi:hypothetical protein